MLYDALARIDAKISLLKAKEKQLIKELEDIRSAIAREEKNLADLPGTINKMKEDLIIKIQSVKSIHCTMQSIPGTIEANQAEIDEVNQIRMHTLNMVEQEPQSL